MSDESKKDPGKISELFPDGGAVADEMRLTLINLVDAIKILIESEVDVVLSGVDRDDFSSIVRAGLNRMYALGHENGRHMPRE